jgi:hypothetical protein
MVSSSHVKVAALRDPLEMFLASSLGINLNAFMFPEFSILMAIALN